jgi:hypothetical protein
VGWCTPAIQALRARQEDPNFQVSLDYIARSCLKDKNKTGLEVELKWEDTCLACTRPWVQSSALPNTINETHKLAAINGGLLRINF